MDKKLKVLKKCIENINKFCLNSIINTSIENQTLNFGKINQNRQKLLAEQYYITIISDLLLILLNESELVEITSIMKMEKRSKFVQKIKACLKKQKYIQIDLKKFEACLAAKS